MAGLALQQLLFLLFTRATLPKPEAREGPLLETVSHHVSDRATVPGPTGEGRGVGGGPQRPASYLGSEWVEPKGP